jgi:[histone H3]-lysine36 N-trimethyltransferase
MEHPGDCLSNTEAHEGRKSHLIIILVQYVHQTQDNEVGDPGDDWVSPPSPPPEDRLPKRSKLDDFVEVECAIKPLGFSSTRTFNPILHPPPPSHRNFPQQDSGFVQAQLMEQAARLARLERTKADTAAIIAAAAAAQKEAEERALVEAAAAAEEQSKEEERNAERERRRKERKEKERGGKKRHHDRDREDNREKRLLKLVGAVVVKTMSKYRTRMDVDTFKKHAKEVGGIPTPS